MAAVPGFMKIQTAAAFYVIFWHQWSEFWVPHVTIHLLSDELLGVASPLLQRPSPTDEQKKTHEKPLLQPPSKIQVDGDVVPMNPQNWSF